MALDLQAVMRDVGPMDDDIGAVLHLTDGRWLVRYADIDVELEHDEATKRVMFSTLIAPVPAERGVEILQALLLYSMAWQETGGIRMALNGIGGAVVQMVDVFAADVDAKLVATVARNLAERVAFWLDFMLAEPVETGPDAARNSTPISGDMIRV